MLLSEPPNFIRNDFHLKVPTEVAVSDIPRCISDVPKYLVLTSLDDVSVALVSCLLAVVCHRTTQASTFVGTASAYCASTGPIFLP